MCVLTCDVATRCLYDVFRVHTVFISHYVDYVAMRCIFAMCPQDVFVSYVSTRCIYVLCVHEVYLCIMWPHYTRCIYVLCVHEVYLCIMWPHYTRCMCGHKVYLCGHKVYLCVMCP